MGKASTAKKVARAARTGGGRTRRGSTSWVWPSLMALVVILGTAGIVYSRDQRQPDGTPPRATDHWHSAIGFYICDAFAPPLPEPSAPAGLHTHADGLVHVEPSGFRSTGKRATLRVLFDSVGASVSASRLKVPGQADRKNGQKCGEAPAKVQTKVWDSADPADPGRLVPGNPSDFRPQDRMLITIAFVPAGADIPRPPSVDQLAKQGRATPPETQPTDSTQPTQTTPATQPTEITPATQPPGTAPGPTPSPTGSP